MTTSSDTKAALVLLTGDELDQQFSRNQSRAARKLEDSRRVLTTQLRRISEAATRAADRLSLDGDPVFINGQQVIDASEIRNLMNTSSLAEAFADVRAAEMMISILADLAE